MILSSCDMVYWSQRSMRNRIDYRKIMRDSKKLHQKWLRSKFLHNIVTLVSGTAIAQVVGLLFVPWITRLYGPEAFGGLGYFSSLLGFLIPLASLCYPLALVLPKGVTEASILFDLSLKIAVVASALIAGVFFFIDSVDREFIPFCGSYILVPLGVFLSIWVAAYTQWAIRCGHYRLIATITILTALTGGVTKVALGYFYPSAISLIMVTIAVLICNLVMLSKNLGGLVSLKEFLSIRVRHCAIAKKYLRFPVYRMPHGLIAIVSQIAPIFLLTSFYEAKYAGYFALTRTVLSAPVTLVGKAVYDATYPNISRRYNANIENFNFILKITVGLTLVSIIPLVIVFLAGDTIFFFIFGAEWERSGVYAAWMALWFAFNFSNKAIAAAVSVYNMDELLFKNGILNILLCLLGFFVGAICYSSDVVSVALFSLCGIFCQCLLITRVLQAVKKAESK